MKPPLNFIQAACVGLFVLGSYTASADIFLAETASMGPTGFMGGAGINSQVFIGARFHVTDPTSITVVGGHFTSGQNGAAGTIFGAIVSLSGPSAFPTGFPFAPGEVLTSALINMPTGGNSTQILVPLPIDLQAGDYMVVFGSGLFGATGQGGLTTDNPRLTQALFPVYAVGPGGVPVWADENITSVPDQNLIPRIVVEGVTTVPEPGACGLLIAGLFGFWLRNRRSVAGSWARP